MSNKIDLKLNLIETDKFLNVCSKQDSERDPSLEYLPSKPNWLSRLVGWFKGSHPYSNLDRIIATASNIAKTALNKSPLNEMQATLLQRNLILLKAKAEKHNARLFVRIISFFSKRILCSSDTLNIIQDHINQLEHIKRDIISKLKHQQQPSEPAATPQITSKIEEPLIKEARPVTPTSNSNEVNCSSDNDIEPLSPDPFDFDDIKHEGLVKLASCNILKNLDLSGCSFAVEGLGDLLTIKHLKELKIGPCQEEIKIPIENANIKYWVDSHKFPLYDPPEMTSLPWNIQSDPQSYDPSKPFTRIIDTTYKFQIAEESHLKKLNKSMPKHLYINLSDEIEPDGKYTKFWPSTQPQSVGTYAETSNSYSACHATLWPKYGHPLKKSKTSIHESYDYIKTFLKDTFLTTKITDEIFIESWPQVKMIILQLKYTLSDSSETPFDPEIDNLMKLIDWKCQALKLMKLVKMYTIQMAGKITDSNLTQHLHALATLTDMESIAENPEDPSLKKSNGSTPSIEEVD